MFLVRRLFIAGLLATALPDVQAYVTSGTAELRTVVTTDMEMDDLTSMLRYLLYTNELDTQGIIYTASRWHWAGDGKGTLFFHPDREYSTPQTSWRWTGNTTIQDVVLKAYAEVYPNLTIHDPFYPTPDELLAIVKLGNIDFEGEMDHDTDGSNLIRALLLDDDPRPLYLQVWGGVNTIARALKSIEDQYSCSPNWGQMKAAISAKAVIMASGFQDDTYANYVAPVWPQIRVENFVGGYQTWGYNCNEGQGNVRGLPDDNIYFTGAWIKPNIEIGPLGSLYFSWLDGKHLAGDPEEVFGNLSTLANSSCKPLGPYDFLSEGDDVAYNPLLVTGIQAPEIPGLGSWGGRCMQNTTSPDLWVLVNEERNQTGDNEIEGYTTNRWIAPAQNEFAARMQWTLTPDYRDANHAPAVTILNGKAVAGWAGSDVTLVGAARDPDVGDTVTTTWWQYFEEGTYPGTVAINQSDSGIAAVVTVPADAKPGETISIILQGTDNGHFPLTRYGRVIITVI